MTIENRMRQAPMTANEYMVKCVEDIDNMFGEGYAKKNPELLGQMVIASSNDFLAMTLEEGFEKLTPEFPTDISIGKPLLDIAKSIEYLAESLGKDETL